MFCEFSLTPTVSSRHISHFPEHSQCSGPHSAVSNQDVMRRLVISAPNIDTSHNGSPALRHLRSEVRRILLETDWTTKPIHNLYIFRSGLQSMFRQRFAFKISSKLKGISLHQSVDLRIISISMLSDVHSEPRPKHAFDVGSCCEILA